MAISDLQTLFGIINGMVGNTILILPLQGLIVGYMGVIIVTTILGIISGYTAYLVIKHLGKAYTIN
jgi:amino acid permease